MEFIYKTATGNIAIDITEEWVAILEECDRLEDNNNLTERRRHYHLDACEYEGEDFAVEDAAFEHFIENDYAKGMVEPALRVLTTPQREVIDALFYKGMSAREYALSKGITEAAVSKAKKVALKKMKKYLADG